MSLMGIDPGTTTGYALARPAGQIYLTGKFLVKAKWSKKTPNISRETVNAQASSEARQWMMAMIKTHDVTAVGIEEFNTFITNSGDGGQMYDPVSREKQFAIQTGIRMACFDLSVPFYTFSDSTWRKSFLGYGRLTIPKTLKGQARKDAQDANRKKLKDDARKRCEEMQIPAKSEDPREAAGVLFHLQCFLGVPRHQSSNAGPLFGEVA